jgi:uncharacterized protein (DUF1501 family)
MKRRNFIKYATAGSILPSLSFGSMPLWASSKLSMMNPEADENILVVIQLFGGNDALNTVIPAEDDRYYNKYRKNLGIAKNRLLRLGGSSSYLNPALVSGPKSGMYGLFNEGDLAVIQGVGYPNPNLSHFRSTDIWLSGKNPASNTERLESGWMARYIDMLNGNSQPEHPTCINIGSSSSLLFQTDKKNLSISVENPQDFYDRGKDILNGDSILTEQSVFADERNFLLDLSIQSNKYSQIVKQAFDAGKNTGKYETDKLSNELKLVAKLITGGLKTKMYLVSIDGFDTHANQGNDTGKHATLLKNISNAVAAFMADLKEQKKAQKVIGMTVSEFGRRPEENASSGTDHGAAGVMFMFGEAVNGKIFGDNLSFDNLDANKDFKHQFDFRQVYEELFLKWFQADAAVSKDILLGKYGIIQDGLIFKKPLSVEEKIEKLASVFPNPSLDGYATVRFSLEKPSVTSIHQIDAAGRTQLLMPQIPMPSGQHSIPIEIRGSAGLYHILIETENWKNVIKIVKL